MFNDFVLEKYKKEDAKEIIEFWNSEIGFIYNIDLPLFMQAVNECKYLFLDGSYIALIDGKIVGFIIAKMYDNNEIISKYFNRGWISLFYVSRVKRKLGIGNNLLTCSEKKLIERGVKSISIGSDMDNFFPGIPNDFDNLTDIFLRKRGYTIGYYTHDLIKKLTSSDSLSIKNTNHEIQNEGIVIRYATKDDVQDLLVFMKINFYGRWYMEALEYVHKNDIKQEYLITIVDGIIVGFLRTNYQLIKQISYNINWRNNFEKLFGIGPLGVNIEYRRRGIAGKMILQALNDAYTFGYSHALIDWTGLVTYYQKFGFQVWKCYAYAQKEVNN